MFERSYRQTETGYIPCYVKLQDAPTHTAAQTETNKKYEQ